MTNIHLYGHKGMLPTVPRKWLNQGLEATQTTAGLNNALLPRHTVMFKWYPATCLIPVVPSTHLLVRRCVQQLIREEPSQGETQLPCLHLSACELTASAFAHINKSSRSAHRRSWRRIIAHAGVTGFLCVPLISLPVVAPPHSGRPTVYYHHADPTRSNLRHPYVPLNNPIISITQITVPGCL